jgi:SAM-dependent methyltransferase
VDRDTVSAITHGDLPFASPLSERDIDDAIAALRLPPASTALDVGCGNGEVLARVKHRHKVLAMGVEPSPRSAALARERIALVHQAPLAEIDPVEGAWDLVICIASSHAFGTWADALAGLRRLARPGGHGLVGEGFWRRAPSDEYLALLGARADELPDHDGLLERAGAVGWEVLEERIASDADWAAYEETLIANGERHLAEEDAPELREWVERARRRWQHPDGRDTLGFALLTLRAA